MKLKSVFFCLASALILSFHSKAQVVINEYSCSNLTQFVDDHSDYGDWFELYNTGNAAVSLQGMYLSDDSLNNLKWLIPVNVNIGAFGFARFWASGRNVVSGTHFHTNFKLTQTKNNKEFIVLSDANGVIQDYVKLTNETKVGHSIGRTQNGGATWGIFTSPTPNGSNNGATSYQRYAARPDFSLLAGHYPASITVDITTTEPNATIRYTIDGNEPTGASLLYNGPVTIPTTKVLKAISISPDPQVLTSLMRFDTYFINVSHTLPIVSVSASLLTNLANGNGNLEPYGSFEYFDTAGVRKAKTYGEFNRHGQDSWVLSQRSLDFAARDEMGYNYTIKEKIFQTTPRDEFQKIILRAAGDDNYPADHNNANAGSAHMRDAYVHMLAKNGGMNLDVRTAAKCIVYLNGAYWGVYDLRENPDDHDFTGYYYGQDKFHLQYIETWGNTWAQYGGAQTLTDWGALKSYIYGNSMADPAKFQYVTDRYDVTSLVDYVIANTFTVCTDWLNYNTGWWRGMDSTGTHLKWGYILWDNDATFDFYINYTNVPSTTANSAPCGVENSSSVSDPQNHIDILNKLRVNPDFNQYYISRQIDMWNTVFSCDNMLGQLDSVIAVIDPEMAQHALRWAGTYTEWVTNRNILRSFIQNRCILLETGFKNCYNLTGGYDITLNTDPAGAGDIKLNTLTHTQLPWTGKYFGGMENLIAVMPKPNYNFVNWSSASQTFSPNVNATNVKVDFNANDSVIAHFTLANGIFELEGSMPNISAMPSVFNSATNLEYYLPENAAVNIDLISASGQKVMTLSQMENQPKGHYMIHLNLAGTTLPSGVYFVNMIAGDHKSTVKLIYSK